MTKVVHQIDRIFLPLTAVMLSTKQHGENRKSGATTISCQLAAAGAALAAGGTTHHVQAGCTDLQDTTDVSAGVSEPPHHDMQQLAVTAIVISSTIASSFQTNVFRQTFLQHCSAICLELSANICSEL